MHTGHSRRIILAGAAGALVPVQALAQGAGHEHHDHTQHAASGAVALSPAETAAVEAIPTAPLRARHA
ncbi:MAG: hypothetical protein AB7O98_08945 [Hyphomonadaceae bacterium]